MRDDRGEAQCPRCGSTNLTYKNVFDYFKCNDCRITFITPVYSYGDEGISGLDSAKDVASQIFGRSQTQPEKKETEPEKPAIPAIERRRRSNPSWLTISLVTLIVILLLVIAWLLFGNEISDFLSGM